MPFGGILTAGLVGGASSLLGGLFGASASKKAAAQQAAAAQQGLDFQKDVFSTEQANQAPFLEAGKRSIGGIMQNLDQGVFGPGSNPAAPKSTGEFHTPTAEEAEATPGYQFTRQQGSKGILQGAAAAGGAISGGTIKALDSFNTGLADSTYNDVFNRSLSTYGAGLQKYQADLAGYQANLAKQGQEFGQLFAPAQLGENATQNINSVGQQAATNVGNLMGQIGNAQAGGTVGSTNALTAGVNNAASGISQSLLLSKLLSGLGPGGKATGKNAPLDLSVLPGQGPGVGLSASSLIPG